MMHVSGYTDLRQIDEGNIHVILRAISEEDGNSVIIKLLRDDVVSTHLGNRLRREFSISTLISDDHIVPVKRLEEHRNLPVLIKHDVGGQSLDRVLRAGQLDVQTALRLAIKIAEAIDSVHARGVMHKDIKPSNIIVNEALDHIWITDFDISSQLRKEHTADTDIMELVGSLPYVSPEQTGRMNRTIDLRTDLYSFGVTLYEMFTGRTPFSANDAMEFVHCHIARQPEPPSRLVNTLPKQLDHIILRLLSKTAEERYQSAFGVASDLKRCFDELQAKNSVDEFPLCTADQVYVLRVPEKLYGRDKQIEQLLSLYDSISASGMCVVTVYGYSGIGKSSLVNETQKPITKNDGRFLSGKFDQYKKSVPYHGLVQALDKFGRMALTGSESSVEQWRQLFLTRLGSDARVVADLIPAFAVLFGDIPDVAELGGHEGQVRMNRALVHTVQVIASAEHPVVLFLDDLQWADSGTLSFLEMLSAVRADHVLLVVAYRDNEVDAAHPSMRTLGVMRDNGVEVADFYLTPLSTTDIGHLLVDTLGTSGDELKPLVALIDEKTGGNPFFIGQFLRALHEDELITFDRTKRVWTWDNEAISRHEMTDNVVELLSGKLRTMPLEHQRVISTAAAIGGEFDLTILAHLFKDVRAMCEALWLPIVEGLVHTTGIQTIADVLEQPGDLKAAVAGLKGVFVHDRIRQAALALTPDAELRDVHRRIARAYFGEYEGEAFEERLFEIASHILAAEGTPISDEEREGAIKFLLKAGMRAHDACAFSVAVEYLNACRRSMLDNVWSSNKQLVETVETARLHALFSHGDFNAVEELCNELDTKPTSRLMQFHVTDQRRRVTYAKLDLPGSIELAIKAMALIGTRFPKKPNKLHAAVALVKVQLMTRGKSVKDLSELPESSNVEALLAIRTIAEISELVYYSNRDLFALMLLKQMELTVKYGNHPNSASVLMGYALIRALALNDVKGAFELTSVSMSMPEKYNIREYVPKNETSYAYLLLHRRHHLAEAYKFYSNAYAMCIEMGMHADTANSTIGPIYVGMYQGKNFEALAKESTEYIKTLISIGQLRSLGTQRLYHATLTAFCDPSMPKLFKNADFDEDEYMALCESQRDYTNIVSHRMNHGLAGLFFSDYARGLHHMELGVAYVPYGKGLFGEFVFPTLHALLLLINVEDASSTEKKKAISRAKKFMKPVRKWVSDAPMNYAHKQMLVDAEIKRAEGKHSEAATLYDDAIDHARKEGFLTFEAIGNDLAARMHDRLGNHERRLAYLRQARQCYRQLGVTGKVRYIEQLAPELAMSRQDSIHSDTLTHETTSMSGTHHGLDLGTVMKASHVIAAEIDRKRLLETTMRIMMENAGADRGVLVMERSGAWNVECEMELNAGMSDGVQRKVEDAVPMNVLGYVNRTMETVVVSNALLDERFLNDPYVIERKPRSILCMAILHQSKRVGIIYLENSLTEGAFTPERIAVLNLLSVQSAISLENAELYEGLERKVAERTKELQEANDALDEERRRSDKLLLNILPAGIVERLKQGERTIADHSTDVSVLFADIANFTQISAKRTPDEVVHMLNEVFNTFDDLVERYALEKIKTIGDAYMVVAGLPDPREDHAIAMAHLAVDMQAAIPTLVQSLGLDRLGLRVGIHTGSVVAGVIGRSKFSYDIWGDTVNMAARMESHGAVGKVHVSQVFMDTINLRENEFTFEQRGVLEVKGKGEMTTYWLSR